MAAEERKAFGEWLRVKRGSQTQADVATKISAMLNSGYGQTWVSGVQRGVLLNLTRREIAALALAVGGDPVEALSLSGELQTPAWAVAMSKKLDRVLAELAKG